MKKCIDCNINDRAKHRRICYACRHKRFKKRNPMRYAYNSLRCNAKRRGKFFDLTFQEFKELCEEYNYMEKKGIYAEDFHIDRYREELGYTKSNLRCITNTENVKKYLKWVGRNLHGENEFRYVSSSFDSSDTEDNCPF